MFKTRIVAVAFISVIALAAVAAQSPRRGTTSRPSTAKPAAAHLSRSGSATDAAGSQHHGHDLAVWGQTISAADIETQVNEIILKDPDPYLHDYPIRIRRFAKRASAVDARIALMLIAAEAKKRGKIPTKFSRAKSIARSAADRSGTKAAYDANRDYWAARSESVRTELVNFIRNQRSQDLYAALVGRLRMTMW